MKTLNVQGARTPEAPVQEIASKDWPKWPSMAAVMSVPRLGFMDNFFCAFSALLQLPDVLFDRLPSESKAKLNVMAGELGMELLPRYRVPIRKYTGAFWGQCLTRVINDSRQRDHTDLIMTIDYDTVFTVENLVAMLDIMATHPEIDAIAPLQIHRTESRPLFTMKDANGRQMAEIPIDAFDGPIAKIHTAHMGCMIFRVSSLLKCKKPYFLNVPDAHGGWEAGRIDEDTYFWERWAEAGNSLYLANRVVVGHGEFMVRWPNEEFGFIDQHPSDFYLKGAPEGIWK